VSKVTPAIRRDRDYKGLETAQGLSFEEGAFEGLFIIPSMLVMKLAGLTNYQVTWNLV
jgi:hypothetical protein